MKTPLTAHLALLFTNFFFAVNYSAIKFFTLHNIAGPFGINILRVGISVILFWMLFLFKKEKQKIEKTDLLKLFICSAVAIGGNQMLSIKGLSYTSPLHASLLSLISPILVTLLASFVLHERLSSLKIIGLALALSGAVLLLGGKATSLGDNFILGDVLVIISAISYAFYFILVKPLMQKYSPLVVTRWIFTFGLILIWPFCISELSDIRFSGFSNQEWLILFLIVVPGTFFAYIFNVYGIKVLNASVAGAYIYTQPLLAGAIAAVFLGESITIHKIFAAVLIFAGLYLAQRAHKKPTIAKPN